MTQRYRPKPLPFPYGALRVAARCDCTQSTADFLCVVGPISHYAIGVKARPTTQALQPRNGIEQRQRLGWVVAIRAGQFDCQWNGTP